MRRFSPHLLLVVRVGQLRTTSVIVRPAVSHNLNVVSVADKTFFELTFSLPKLDASTWHAERQNFSTSFGGWGSGRHDESPSRTRHKRKTIKNLSIVPSTYGEFLLLHPSLFLVTGVVTFSGNSMTMTLTEVHPTVVGGLAFQA